MSTDFIRKFLNNPEEADLDLDLIQPLNVRDRPTFELSESFFRILNSFLRIYYSSDAFDLGNVPQYNEPPYMNYEFESVSQQIHAGLGMFDNYTMAVNSIQERASAIHNAWAHNYLYWRLRGYASNRDHLLVPLEQLPTFERQKRYFIAELVTLLFAIPATGCEITRQQEKVFGDLCIQAASYHVAFEVLRSLNPNVPTPAEILATSIEVADDRINSFPF